MKPSHGYDFLQAVSTAAIASSPNVAVFMGLLAWTHHTQMVRVVIKQTSPERVNAVLYAGETCDLCRRKNTVDAPKAAIAKEIALYTKLNSSMLMGLVYRY